MSLKKYKDEQVKVDKKKYEASGVESPKTKGEELKVMVPYIVNERGEYRVVDEKANWLGWIKYKPPVAPQPAPQPAPKPPTPEEQASSDLNSKLNEYRKKMELVELGIYTDADLGLPKLKGEIQAIVTQYPQFLES